MFKNFIRILSLLLIVSMLWNMLPVSVLGADLREALNADDDAVLIEPDFTLEEKEPEEITILGELTERRTENIKEYLLSNGNTLAAVYGDSVHYQENGEWKDIDNTLIAKNGTYVNTAGAWDVSFPQTLSGNNRISITKDGYTLSFGMVGKLTLGSSTVVTKPGENVLYGTEMGTVPTITLSAANTSQAQLQQLDFTQAKADAQHPELVRDKLTSRLSYSQVYANTDVIYDLDSNRVKESVILSQYDSALRGYRYTLHTGGMIPVLSDDGHIDFYDAQGEEIVMTMPAPFLVDANSEYNWDVQVDLSGSGSTYTLTYTLPRQWLAAEERAWPVILDPEVEGDNSYSNVQDQTVFSNGSKDYTWGIVQCGYSATLGISRFYMKFSDLPVLSSADVIVDAQVTMGKAVASSNPFYVGVHGVTGNWSSNTITWATKPDFDTNAADFVMVKEKAEYTWDVTDIARGWYETGVNNGMMFKASDTVETQSTANHWSQFYSSDYGAYEPEMTLEYRNTSGLESYWDYISASAGRAGTAYVNASSGNLVFVRNLMGFGGNRMPVSIDLVYNASEKGNNSFGVGYGWRTNYHQTLEKLEGTDYYIWTDADGTRHYFNYNAADGFYYDEDNLGLKLSVCNDIVTIEDLLGNTSTFDINGRLTMLQNNQETPSSINITYTTATGNHIATITDGAGRVYTFSYAYDMLTRVSYMATAQTEQHYVSFNTSGGILMNICEKGGGGCYYAYANRLLTKARDPHGVSLDWSYYTEDEGHPNRVKQISENDGSTTGNYIELEYGDKWTRLTDKQGNVRYLLFNTHGNTISIQNDKGAAAFAEYAADQNATEQAHKLVLASDLQDTTINLLTDGNFEDASSWYSVTNGTANLLSSGAYIGAKALNVEASSTTNATVSFGSFTVDPGKSYTLSAYLKTETGKAFLRFTNGSTVYAHSLDTTEADLGQWKRFEVTYTNKSSASQTVCAEAFIEQGGVTAIDCVQLERAISSGRYNLVENSDFTVPKTSASYKWSESNLTSEDGRETTASVASVIDGNAMKISGDPTAQKRVSQRINIAGSAGDVFVFAGWGKGYVPRETEIYYGQRWFGLQLTFHNSSGTIIGETYHLPFSPHMNSWQYAAGQAKAEADYAYIVVSLVCDYNVNTVFFDGIQLYRGGLGNDYDYNDNGDVTKVTNAQGQITTYSYTGRDLTQVTNHDGSTVSYVYDAYKNIKKETVTYPAENVGEEPVQYVTDYTYDTYGNTTSVTSTGAGTTSATYTENGNYLATVTDAQNRTTAYCYSNYTGVLVNTTDPLGNVVAYGHDGLLRQTNARQMVGGNLMAVAYGYSGDRLTSVTTPSTAYAISYGAFATVQSITAGDYTLATYEYDADRNLSDLIYGNGCEIEYTYDSEGRVIEERYINGTDIQTVTYAYDEEGKLISINDGLANYVTTYRYDTQNRVASIEIYENGIFLQSVRYDYNEYNQLIEKTDVIGTQTPIRTSYSYNSLHLQTEINKDDIYQQAIYNGLGLLQHLTTGYTTDDPSTSETNCAVKEETYLYGADQDGYSDTELYQHTTSYGGKANTDTYTYDALGNITQIVRKFGSKEYIIKYTYDAANQLIREDNQQAGYTWVMTYDDAGNMLTRKKYSYTTGTLGAVLSTQTFTYGKDGWGDILTKINSTTVTSDASGNLLSDGTNTYTWKNGRQLATVTRNGATWTNTYDASGMRTQRVSGSTIYAYIYDGGNLSQMTVGSNALIFTYSINGQPMSVKYNGIDYYYVTNTQGDVVGILNSSGTEVVTYTYDAWGNILSTTGSLATTLGAHNPLRYRGYVYDQETGLYYLQSRYYNPTICRFISADAFTTTGQGLLGNNMFAYCGNDPINRKDPSGQFWVAALIVTVAVVIYAAVLSGCTAQPTSDVGAAQPYVDMPGSNDPTSPNCYAYAIGSPVNEQPGGASGRIPTQWYNVNDVGKSVEADLKAKGYTVRKISGPDAKVYDNEFKIALRVGTQPYAYNKYTGELYYDYHFMRQTSTGQWAEKHGYGGASVLWDAGMTPDTIPWTLNGVAYYDSTIIYYAIGK